MQKETASQGDVVWGLWFSWGRFVITSLARCCLLVDNLSKSKWTVCCIKAQITCKDKYKKKKKKKNSLETSFLIKKFWLLCNVDEPSVNQAFLRPLLGSWLLQAPLKYMLCSNRSLVFISDAETLLSFHTLKQKGAEPTAVLSPVFLLLLWNGFRLTRLLRQKSGSCPLNSQVTTQHAVVYHWARLD